MLVWLKKWWPALVCVGLMIAMIDGVLSSLLTCHPVGANTGSGSQPKTNEECTALKGPLLISLAWILRTLHKNEGAIVGIFTIVLAVFTARLWSSTDKLWEATRTLASDAKTAAAGQAADTRILQRAYVGVLPLGVRPFRTDKAVITCLVGFHNAGNLPARNVRWELNRDFDTDMHRTDFNLTGEFTGGIVIPPEITAPKGSAPISRTDMALFKDRGKSDDRWLYVWGSVRYLDGFGADRFTKFCHRYNVAAATEGEWAIDGSDARYHEHGNDAD